MGSAGVVCYNLPVVDSEPMAQWLLHGYGTLGNIASFVDFNEVKVEASTW